MKHPHHTLILNHFPPLKRKPLLRWLRDSHVGKRTYHQAFLACLQELSQVDVYRVLDRRTRIAFSVLYEFGERMASRPMYQKLIDAVEHHMGRQRLH